MIEGDYIYVRKLGYMAVKGVSHPPGLVIAIPRYDNNMRRIGGLYDAYAYVKDLSPEFLLFDDHAGQTLPLISVEFVDQVLSPRSWRELLAERKGAPINNAVRLLELLLEAGRLDEDDIGITGSLLLGAFDEHSDIDLVFYTASEAMETLAELRARGVLKPVSSAEPGDLPSKRRDSDLPLDLWVKHEGRKLLYGLYGGRVYSAKVVPHPNEFWEPYGSRRWREVGRATVRAVIIDSSRGIYTPNAYSIEIKEVVEGNNTALRASEVTSFRSRFAEQAKEGEEVMISGRLEVDLNSGDVRLFLGNSPSDYMLSKALL